VKPAFVNGAERLIGSRLVHRLKYDGFWVRGLVLKFSESEADDFVFGDLRDPAFCTAIIDRHFDEVYLLAADVGAPATSSLVRTTRISSTNAQPSTSTCWGRSLYSSPACMHSAYNQEDANRPSRAADSAYPAASASEYGWEKLFSERHYLAYHGSRRSHSRRAACGGSCWTAGAPCRPISLRSPMLRNLATQWQRLARRPSRCLELLWPDQRALDKRNTLC
jgi:nucleoside-diphosphate-sugar epimerase